MASPSEIKLTGKKMWLSLQIKCPYCLKLTPPLDVQAWIGEQKDQTRCIDSQGHQLTKRPSSSECRCFYSYFTHRHIGFSITEDTPNWDPSVEAEATMYIASLFGKDKVTSIHFEHGKVKIGDFTFLSDTKSTVTSSKFYFRGKERHGYVRISFDIDK